jgi:hypothetical protein
MVSGRAPAYFYYEESCGQAVPRTGWLYRILNRTHGEGVRT